MDPSVTFTYGILIGVLIGLLFKRYNDALWKWLEKLAPPPATGAVIVPSQTAQASAERAIKTGEVLPPIKGFAPEELAAELRALELVIEPEASSAAHPRAFENNAKFLEAVQLFTRPEVPIDVVEEYAIGPRWVLSCAALAALAKRNDRDEVVSHILDYFDNITPWAIYFALAYFLACNARPAVGAPLRHAKDWWRDNIFIAPMFRDHLAERERFGDPPTFDYGVGSATAAQHAVIKGFLERVHHPMATALLLNLDSLRHESVDRTFLSSFGRFWTCAKGHDILIEPPAWHEALDDAAATASEAPVRSLLVSGETRVGKTSFLCILAKRLEREGWSVFEAGGGDLMAGQQYFGQLEGRIQKTLEELNVSKKLIWYIPDVLQIAMSGTHQGQAASILDQILPAIAAGRLIVWTEASPAVTARLLRLLPTLRSTFEIARMEPLEADETLELGGQLVKGLGEAAGVAIDEACVTTALDLAKQYLNGSNLPGPVFDLLKLTAGRGAKGDTGHIGPEDVVVTLSQFTGLPASLLDNRERVDLAAVRGYFTERVIGQDEAISAIVERIAMLKAGLNDGGKPIGVFLFAGPTGTGKTELAKTLAEFLFGSPDRMIRLDMSEFQTPDSTSKILGTSEAAQPTDSLIMLVRKQPFSVVLLDEFEKAHANVWDLFLQVFDDGRLTDQLGQVGDFRHCIIILTTNLGATSHRSGGIGFSPATDRFSGEQISRAVAQTFRPEFQNRLDKVIVFRPLTRELMRSILKKELSRVLERRGLKDREWAVEWEASALEFLLEKGFTPEMGARPLKRAIDQYVIAPLAATIVEKRFPEGDQFVFVRSDGRAIQAEFVDPDAETTEPEPVHAAELGELPALTSMMLAQSGSDAELAALATESEGVEAMMQSAEWEQLKERLSAAMQESGFWSRPDRFETLARLALMDRVRAAAETGQSLRSRLARGTERAGKSSRELIARLAMQLHLVKEGIRDAFDGEPIEVAVLIEPALEKPADRDANRVWCGQLLDMYRAWAKNRNMQLTEQRGDIHADGEVLPTLLISGFGAHRLLRRETGLHVLELADDGGPSRATARVRVAPVPLGELSPERLRRALKEALDRAGVPSAVVRRYRGDPSPLVRDMTAGWRSGRFDAVLRGDFDLIAAAQG
jgi:ATP-dependent Clp protease ATP-binding subunit ClpC